MRDLLAGVVRAARARDELPRGGPPATAVADIALTFTRGLEADPTDPDAARTLLRRGVALLAAGLRAPSPSARLSSLRSSTGPRRARPSSSPSSSGSSSSSSSRRSS